MACRGAQVVATSLPQILAPQSPILLLGRETRARLPTRAITSPRLLEHLVEERSTPAASRTGTKTVGQLPGTHWVVETDEVEHFPARHVKTNADFVVQVHGPVPAPPATVASRSATRQAVSNSSRSNDSVTMWG